LFLNFFPNMLPSAPKNAYLRQTGSATMLETADYGNLAGFLIGEYSSRSARAT
jgi:hypothetical protein